MDNEETKGMLYKMVGVEGLLRIITNECAVLGCQGDEHDESEYRLTDPRHFVIHKVVRLEELPNNQVRAHSAEGDWCQGQPEAVLRRLQRWNMSGTVVWSPQNKDNIFKRLFNR